MREAFSVSSESFPRVPLWVTDGGSYASTNVRMAGRASALVARLLAGIALATSLALPLACSSSSSKVPITTTSIIVVTTSRSSTSTSSTTTTSTDTTTIAPKTTTTVDRASKAEADVRASVKAATDAFGACLLALPNCDVASLAQTRRGRLLELNSARLSQWNQEGYAVREREKFRYVIESVTVDADGKHATANVCIADGSKLVSRAQRRTALTSWSTAPTHLGVRRGTCGLMMMVFGGRTTRLRLGQWKRKTYVRPGESHRRRCSRRLRSGAYVNVGFRGSRWFGKRRLGRIR